MSRLEDIFQQQYILQRDSFGHDPGRLEGKEFADFVRWNVLALEDELHEFLGELDWKPWSDKQGRPEYGTAEEHAAHSELVDVLHFFVNLCLALRLDAEGLSDLYHTKRRINAERQKIGYTQAREEGL